MSAATAAAVAETPTADPALLDESVEGVLIQFFLRHRDLVPMWLLRNRMQRQLQSGKKKKKVKQGTQIIPSTEEVGVAGLIDGLRQAKYSLVDAFVEERGNDDVSSNRFFAVRFLFHPASDPKYKAEASQQLAAKNYIAPALVHLCYTSLWRVRAFRNPVNYAAVERFGIAVQCEARVPLSDHQGSPILRWKKDERSQRTGEKPEPLVAQKILKIINGRLALV